MPGHPGRACARPSVNLSPGIYVFTSDKRKSWMAGACLDEPGHDVWIEFL